MCGTGGNGADDWATFDHYPVYRTCSGQARASAELTAGVAAPADKNRVVDRA
jgi:hypothetical protein